MDGVTGVVRPVSSDRQSGRKANESTVKTNRMHYLLSMYFNN